MLRRMSIYSLAILLGGCDAEDGSICRAGFTLAPDGHCYPPPPDPRDPTVADVLDALEDCEPLEPTGEIDLTAGCAEDACVGQRFETLDALVNSKGDANCDAYADTRDVECVWGGTIAARFAAQGDDPDAPAATAGADWVRLLRSYGGATFDGLGTQVAPRCFVEVLNEPDLVVFADVEGSLRVRQMTWDRFGLIVLDNQDARDNEQPDGIVDQLLLLGAP